MTLSTFTQEAINLCWRRVSNCNAKLLLSLVFTQRTGGLIYLATIKGWLKQYLNGYADGVCHHAKAHVNKVSISENFQSTMEVDVNFFNTLKGTEHSSFSHLYEHTTGVSALSQLPYHTVTHGWHYTETTCSVDGPGCSPCHIQGVLQWAICFRLACKSLKKRVSLPPHRWLCSLHHLGELTPPNAYALCAIAVS